MWVISPGSPWCGPSNREDPVLLQGMSPDRPRTMCRLRCRKHSRSIPDSFQKLGWMVRTRWNPMLSYTYICPYTYAYTGIYMNIHIYIYIYTYNCILYIHIIICILCYCNRMFADSYFQNGPTERELCRIPRIKGLQHTLPPLDHGSMYCGFPDDYDTFQ